jgi:hypothetical protein
MAEQPTQFLSLQEEDLNPLLIILSLWLLLISASERGCFFDLTVLFLLTGVLGLGTSASSYSSSSKTREVSSKFEQAEKLEEGQEGGIEKRYDLPGLFAERIFQAGDFRIELAQSKVVDCIRRKVKKLIQASGMETIG